MKIVLLETTDVTSGELKKTDLELKIQSLEATREKTTTSNKRQETEIVIEKMTKVDLTGLMTIILQDK